MADVKRLNKPPVCDACERLVKETSSRPILLGCDAMLCKDCWEEWYDGAHENAESLKRAVWGKHGEFGSEANLTALYKRREEKAHGDLGAGI